jgi:hypothetical protein
MNSRLQAIGPPYAEVDPPVSLGPSSEPNSKTAEVLVLKVRDILERAKAVFRNRKSSSRSVKDGIDLDVANFFHCTEAVSEEEGVKTKREILFLTTASRLAHWQYCLLAAHWHTLF